jgi:hypothetical protein
MDAKTMKRFCVTGSNNWTYEFDAEFMTRDGDGFVNFYLRPEIALPFSRGRLIASFYQPCAAYEVQQPGGAAAP